MAPLASSATLGIAATSSLGYFLVYLMRYPIFMLPEEIQQQRFASFAGVDMTLQEALSLAFCIGLGLAKFPAVRVMSSPFFFRHRYSMLVLLALAGGLLPTLPLALTQGEPKATALGLFLGCFPQSWIYGGIVVYLEGRRSTELLLAIMACTFTFGGGAARGVSTAVLAFGVDPCWMPCFLVLVALPPIMLLFFALDKMPPPTAEDMAHRQPRRAMTPDERKQFLKEFGPGIAFLVAAYMSITALRQFRDLFSVDLFTAANTGVEPSPEAFFVVDIPGAVATGCIIAACGRFENNAVALLAMILAMAGLLMALALATTAFADRLLGVFEWQMLLGIGIMASYSLLSGSPIYDRLVAASGKRGVTSTFLIYVSDIAGYAGTIGLVLWKTLVARGSGGPDVLRQFYVAQAALSAAAVVCLVAAVWYFWWKFGPLTSQTARSCALVSA